MLNNRLAFHDRCQADRLVKVQILSGQLIDEGLVKLGDKAVGQVGDQFFNGRLAGEQVISGSQESLQGSIGRQVLADQGTFRRAGCGV